MQKYRTDYSEPQSDGAVLWYAKWWGGPTLSKIENCRLVNLDGDNRATVYITGEADTVFSFPAVCSFRGVKMRGYVTSDDGLLVFRHTYY